MKFQGIDIGKNIQFSLVRIYFNFGRSLSMHFFSFSLYMIDRQAIIFPLSMKIERYRHKNTQLSFWYLLSSTMLFCRHHVHLYNSIDENTIDT